MSKVAISKAAHSKVTKSKAASTSNVLLVEVPPQFVALCDSSGVSPQSALRGMAAMLCGLRYDEDNRLPPLESVTRTTARRGASCGILPREDAGRLTVH